MIKMSTYPDGRTADKEDSDSFYSFNESDWDWECFPNKPALRRLSASCKSSDSSTSDSANESEHGTTVAVEEYTTKRLPQAAKDSSPKVLVGIPKPMGRCKAPKKPMSPWKVPEMASKQMPSEKLFNLDSPQLRLKDYLTPDPQTEAMQKYAFTEIWVYSQNKPIEPKRSPLEFSVALDAYFSPDQAKKSPDIVQPIVKSAKTIVKG